MFTYDEEAIIAQCTPSGQGAIALLRLSGSNAFAVADRIGLISEKSPLSLLPTHTIHYGWVVHNNERIDQVLFLIMRAPHSFTGQDTLEITCHNNPFVIDQIIQAALVNGARLAREGEFTKRAFLSGKIDILQAEAINELIKGQSHYALKHSLAQLQGSFSAFIVEIEKKLIKAIALAEASFEFLDEENLSFGQDISILITEILSCIENLKHSFDQQKHLRQGIRVAIIGSVNAGKSSLFNVLIGQERAIVTPMPGTTRDVIEAGFYRNGIYWTLIDTAGLRETDDVIEQEGIRRSKEQAHLADIVLLVIDQSQLLPSDVQNIYQHFIELYHHKMIIIFNKSDAPHQVTTTIRPDIIISTKMQTNIDNLLSLLEDKIDSLFATRTTPFLPNKRHYLLLLELERGLQSIYKQGNQREYELISYHLRDMVSLLSELTGKSITEQTLDAIFKEFCVGK